jgi:hypothetical protein
MDVALKLIRSDDREIVFDSRANRNWIFVGLGGLMVAVALAGHGSGHLGARAGVLAVGAILALDCITMLAPSNPSKLWLLNDQRPGRKEPNTMIISVDCRPSFQTIARL